MTNTWVTGYREVVSRLLAEKGTFVALDNYGRDVWPADEDDESDYDATYGWSGAYYWTEHLGKKGCSGIRYWEHESLRERSLSLFDNTFTDNKDEIGIEMRATCACGEYTDRWVRWVGTLGQALEIILKGDDE